MAAREQRDGVKRDGVKRDGVKRDGVENTEIVHDWFRDAVIYELHVRAFADSNGDGIGDFEGLTARLDHLVGLGVTALWLLPFYPSPLRDDGYDIADYRSINPDYGTMRTFRRFMTEAHRRGMKVITELVVNHTSDQHPWFERARRAPRGSRLRDFYVWTDDPSLYSDARVIFSDFETSNWTWDPVAQQYYWHRFYSHQPDLNYDNPAVEEAVLSVLDYWMGFGVDGVRLDAVPYLYEREGTNCENLPETHALLKRIRSHVDQHHPGAMLLAEANQWPQDAAAYFGDGDECHMNFHFPLMPRLFMAIQAESRMPIVDVLEQTPEPPEGAQWATFLRNHDELTLEMVTDEERNTMLRAYARDDEMRINLGIRRRLAPLLGNDRRKIELMNALLFSLPGTPVVYYGDEIGMGDNVYLGDRDGVRTPMQWSADRNGGFSHGNPHRLYLPLITEQQYHYESVNVDAQMANPSSLLAWMRQLIALRNRHRVFGRGGILFLDPDNPHVLAFVRHLEGEAPMLCVANLSRLAQHVELDVRQFAGSVPVEVFGRTRFGQLEEGSSFPLTLAPFGFFWIELTPPVDHAPEGPVHVLEGGLADALARPRPLARALANWLPHRRWFGGKDAKIREVHVDDSFALPNPKGGRGDEAALLIVTVSFAGTPDQRYSVPVVRATGDRARSIEHARPAAVIARFSDDSILADALVDGEGATRIVQAALSRRTIAGRRGSARGRPIQRGAARITAEGRDVTVLGVEQSNNSVLFGHDLIAKIVRRIEPGLNPDVEMPRRLAATDGAALVPEVVATLDVSLANEPETANVVIVHQAVTHESDLWVRTLDDLSRAIDQTFTDSNQSDVNQSSLALAEMLGRRTAQLHKALASPAVAASGGPNPSKASFGPEPFTLLWQRSLLQALRNSARQTRRDLRRHAAGRRADEELAEQTAWIDAHLDPLIARFEDLQSTKMQAVRIRVHGDLHLGQILWTGTDIVFIDFEGQPGQPIDQRTIKRSPLADVAGLWRSFDYAGRIAVHTAEERGRVTSDELEAVHAFRARWTAQVQHTLVEAYLDEVEGTGLVPPDPDDARKLLELYVLMTSLYEVRYELANRPDWAAWPLDAIRDIATGVDA